MQRGRAEDFQTDNCFAALYVVLVLYIPCTPTMAGISYYFYDSKLTKASNILVPLLLLLLSSTRIQASSTDTTVPKKTQIMPIDSIPSDIRIVFSDVDGTLVHYPDLTDGIDVENNGNRILRLPTSATGMQGIISSQTFVKCHEVRSRGVKLVLVSGMRTSTLLKRLPFLPKADAYCSEAGGRIFLRKDAASDNDNNNQRSFNVKPESYEGAEARDLMPFDIVEDMEWRRKMQRVQAAGTDGYHGAELDLQTSQEMPVPIADRVGTLWDFARHLSAKGYVLDTEGYASCFRVNRKQQTQVSNDDFEELLHGHVLECPPELGTSVNLGCIDYYPVESGKKNW